MAWVRPLTPSLRANLNRLAKKSQVSSAHDGLDTPLDAKFAVDIAAVLLDGMQGHDQPVRDLLV